MHLPTSIPISSISGRCVAFIYLRNLCSKLSIKVSIAFNQSLANEIVKCKITDQSPLCEADPLSDVFPQKPAERSLHIVIRVPPGEYAKRFTCHCINMTTLLVGSFQRPCSVPRLFPLDCWRSRHIY